MGQLDAKHIALLVATEGIEQVELTEPRAAVEDAGAETDLVSVDHGEVQAFDHLTAADTFPVDRVVSEVTAEDYDGLILPGGVANPDNLRQHDDAVELVRAFVQTGRPIAAICHAPWTLVEAEVVAGRTLTSYPSLATDLRNAGATWVDEEVRIDDSGPNVIVTSRNPDDLDAFCKHTVDQLARA